MKSFRKNRQPWVTKGISRSITKRNQLYKRALKSKCSKQLDKYKKYRNILTSLIRLSRRLYYSNKLEENKQSSTLLWSTVNDIIGEKQVKHTDTFTIIDGQQLSDPAIISSTFNSYFTNIGPKLASNIETGAAHFTDYLPQTCEKSLFLNPTNSHEIIEIVRNLKNSKSSAYDEICVNLL